MKFAPFGNVKDLEIITREDDAGIPLKTFAYINIDISEKNFQKCLTVYNNCSWKGNVLKVQSAKENFLSRLQKEKIATSEKEERSVTLHNSVPTDAKSAVPGTRVPNKRNWVIGKFGRALPIVFLRRKDGKKVAKFDPSKTVHCLKRIRDEDSHCLSVDNLTWKIDSSLESENVEKTSREYRWKKRSIGEIDGKDDIKKNTKTKMKKSHDHFHTGESESSSSSGCSKIYDFSRVKDVSHNLTNNDIDSLENENSTQEIKKSSTTRNDHSLKREINAGLSSLDGGDDTCVSDVSTYVDDKLMNARGSSPENETDHVENEIRLSKDAIDESLKVSSSESESELEHIPRNHEVKCLNGKQEILSNNICSADEQTDLLHDGDNSLLESEILSEGEYQVSNSDNSTCPNDDCSTFDVNNSSSETATYPVLHQSVPTTKSNCRVTTNLKFELTEEESKRKEASNKLRLKSLKERTQVIKKQRDVVKNALQNVDAGHFTSSNHLVLDRVDEELKIPPGGKKITGSEALSWLGMESSSDEDVNQNEETFDWKEHFHGHSGEKLMKIQQKFGHDQRFKMDERFLESDEELVPDVKSDLIDQRKRGGSSFDSGSEGDEIDQQLKEEKQLALKVLQSVLGNNSVFIGENDDHRNQYRDSSTTHYDPSREDHMKFEETSRTSVSPKSIVDNTINNETSEKSEPAVTKSKFYSVSDTLKNFFGEKKDECKTFSFFPDFPEIESVGEDSIGPELDKVTAWKSSLVPSQSFPNDSSTSESESESENTSDLPAISSGPKTDRKRHLFYHSEDEDMLNTLKEESSSFIRKESLETLEKYWVDVRQNLTQDYKKKRKDALRRQKKITHKKLEK